MQNSPPCPFCAATLETAGVVSRITAIAVACTVALAALPGTQALAQQTPPAGDAPGNTSEIGTPYMAASHGDWSLMCTRSAANADPCELYQLLRDGSGTSVAEITLVDLPARASEPGAVAGAVLVTPLETYLPAQIQISVDAAPAKVYRFEYCAAMGCVARIALSADDIATYQGGKTAAVTIAAAIAPNQPVTLEMSLAGFTAGYRAMQEANAAADANQPRP